MKKLWEKLKPVIEAIKAAKMLYSLILLLWAYTGYQEANKLLTEPVKPVEATIEPIPATVKTVKAPAIDYKPIIEAEVRKQIKAHEHSHHWE